MKTTMKVLCAAVIGLLLVGCAAQATPVTVTVLAPQTVVVTREVTRVVTQEVTREVTRVVTATPSPAPTATVTPAVAAPAGWVTYTHPTGAFSLWMPADAVVSRESAETTTFELAGQVAVVIALVDGPVEVGDEKTINEFVRSVLDVQNALDTVKVTGRGALTSPLAANYVETTITDYAYGSTNFRLDLAAPLSSSRSVRGVLMRHLRAVTEADRQMLGTMLATLSVR